MNLSLNEVETTAKKAARGAGYPWGLAEDAAKATRWLCARGIEGCAELAALLQQMDGSDAEDWAPRTPGDMWEAGGGMLCPLATGAAVADRAYELGTNAISIGAIAAPILLIPFVATAAQQRKAIVSVTWSGFAASTDGDRLDVSGAAGSSAQHVTVSAGGQIKQPMPRCTRADPQPEAWEILSGFAHRTYAPATEESRLLGAGAGLSDND